jgi:hypothetical protein
MLKAKEATLDLEKKNYQIWTKKVTLCLLEDKLRK